MPAPVLNDLTLGKYLKIVSKGAVYNNLSEDSPLWDMIKKKKKGSDEGREQRFLIRSAYGAPAAGFVPVKGGAYRKGVKSKLSEGIANYKDFALTVEVERTAVARAISDFSRYGEPLAEELRAKTISLSRQLSMSLYKDGTGVIAQSGAAAGNLAAGQATVTLSSADTARGFVGWLEEGDYVVTYAADGTAVEPSSLAAYDHYEVVSKDRVAGTVVLQAKDVNNNDIGATQASNIINGTLIYRGTKADIAAGNITAPSDISALSSSSELNLLSDDWIGLAGFATSGVKANGILQSGRLAITQRDASGNPIDSQDFQQVMSQLMVAAGRNRYKYSSAMMAWEVYDALVESRETDRRFDSINDNKRGVQSLGYQHGSNAVIFTPDEFCPKNRVYICPEGDVLQFFGSDFETVKPDGGKGMHLKPNSSGYDRTMQMFMEGHGVLISVHNQAIGMIRNFTV